MLEQLVQIQILHKTVLRPTPLQLQMLGLVALMWLVLELLVEVVAQLRR